jgi:hypothetical protein
MGRSSQLGLNTTTILMVCADRILKVLIKIGLNRYSGIQKLP